MANDNVEKPSTCMAPSPDNVLRAEYVQSLAKYATDNFQKLDTDGNNYITTKELDAAAAKAGSAQERQFIGSLQNHYSDLANYADRDWFSHGISRDDLARLSRVAGNMPQNVAIADKIAEVGLAKWAQFAGDDDRVRTWQLDAAMKRVDANATPCEKQVFDAIKTNYYDISHLHAKIRSIKDYDLSDYASDMRYRYRLIFNIAKDK